jgi:peptide/nickel transport system substrate-binding protein
MRKPIEGRIGPGDTGRSANGRSRAFGRKSSRSAVVLVACVSAALFFPAVAAATAAGKVVRPNATNTVSSSRAGASESSRVLATLKAAESSEPRAQAPSCNTKKIVVTYYSEPSIEDFQQFGTDGDNDVRANTIGTLLSRKFVTGKYAGTTYGETGEYVGNDASSWNNDLATKTLTFFLRPGLKFSDGSPVTSADVEFSFLRGLEDPLSYLPSIMRMLTITSPSQITTPNATTIEFHYLKFNPFTYELMSIWATGILSEKFVKEHATPKDPWANAYLVHHMLSTGPYVLTNVVSGVSYDLTPNPYYWNKAQYPCNGGIDIEVTADASARELLVEKGAVDVARSIDYTDVKNLQSNANLTVLDYSTADMTELGLNAKVAPFNNVKVRQAIAYAVPYKQILADVYAGYASPLDSIVPPNMPTTDPSTWPYSTNLAKAKTLLAEAGYPKGFSTQLWTVSTASDEQTAAVLIAASLANIGVTVTIEKLASAAYAARQGTQRNFPMFFWYWISFTNDPYYDFTFLTSCGAYTNYTNYCNPEVDSLIAKGMYDQNPTSRASISDQVQSIVAQGATDIGLGTPDDVIVMGKDIHGWNEQVDLNARYYTLWKS